MLRIFYLLFLISVFFQTNDGIAQEVSAKDYQVYSSIIDQFLSWYKVKKRNIVIISDSDYRVYELKSAMWHKSIADLSDELDSLNKESVKFENSFQLKRKKTILESESEIDLLFEDGVVKGWKKFYEKYPRCAGYIRVSRIWYNSDSSKCLVYLALMRDGLAGGGYYILFDLKQNTIESSETVWQA